MTRSRLRILSTLLIATCVSLSGLVQAAGPFKVPGSSAGTSVIQLMSADSSSVKPENERLVSTSLAVLLGAFGAHRIYLGTSPKVAVIYGITFGGFGVLVLLDLGHLILSKDLAPYRDNERVIMWGSPKEQLTPQ
ncbi:MAG: TM2 domain-containing protein [Flavobacteriales bacterium]